MRSFATVAAAAALVSTAAAAPFGWGDWAAPNPATCMSNATVQYLVAGFGSLLSDYNTDVANTILADDLVDWSDSINSLIGAPVGNPTFPTKAAFEAGQGAQPAVPFEVLAIEAYTCDTIAFRWLVPLPPNPIKGITILKTENSAGQADTWQIKTIFTEFNSIAWLEDIGGSVTYPKTS
ncbi:hypothetical protein LTR10_014168 [Elasticomyces elasticus]|uniref:NTF2-like domain-containing protein n=1 Tax=Exophiala sideris TaxID=1016849 RepID=A0ABR0J4J7_9EURO|nr:hypothetical protein LTR10_014168 [Elasticomyces elasticus]KAK5026576.1 hypothetical protein LTS07_007510 [Exophiala sideris]KAK5033684.1 hypothetical protein LTR13_006736 [Exophiala sideris]KAK5055507.1 hypothetical protein LTR69_008340 [Exophiala sideris]KAK5180111.1 hypothetical protein LTR44_007587 [Eurotiomycetes sp. CCFEE 6388]